MVRIQNPFGFRWYGRQADAVYQRHGDAMRRRAIGDLSQVGVTPRLDDSKQRFRNAVESWKNLSSDERDIIEQSYMNLPDALQLKYLHTYNFYKGLQLRPVGLQRVDLPDLVMLKVSHPLLVGVDVFSIDNELLNSFTVEPESTGYLHVLDIGFQVLPEYHHITVKLFGDVEYSYNVRDVVGDISPFQDICNWNLHYENTFTSPTTTFTVSQIPSTSNEAMVYVAGQLPNSVLGQANYLYLNMNGDSSSLYGSLHHHLRLFQHTYTYTASGGRWFCLLTIPSNNIHGVSVTRFNLRSTSDYPVIGTSNIVVHTSGNYLYVYNSSFRWLSYSQTVSSVQFQTRHAGFTGYVAFYVR